MGWVVQDFSTVRATGKVCETETGREAAFAIEAWWPCDPKTARDLDDSDARRHLLLPRAGEPVEITWKRNYRGDEVPARVARVRPIERLLPQRSFREWLAAMVVHIPELGAFAPEDEAEDTADDPTPRDPVQHLGLVAWVGGQSWIAEGPGAVALEAGGSHSIVRVVLAPATVAALVEARLVLPA